MTEQRIQKAHPSSKAMNKLTKMIRINFLKLEINQSLQQPEKHLGKEKKGNREEAAESW